MYNYSHYRLLRLNNLAIHNLGALPKQFGQKYVITNYFVEQNFILF